MQNVWAVGWCSGPDWFHNAVQGGGIQPLGVHGESCRCVKVCPAVTTRPPGGYNISGMQLQYHHAQTIRKPEWP